MHSGTHNCTSGFEYLGVVGKDHDRVGGAWLTADIFMWTDSFVHATRILGGPSMGKTVC